MTPDFEAFIKKRFWWVPRRPLFYLSAVWVGSQIAAYAVAVGLHLSGAKPQLILHLLITSPGLYLSVASRLTALVLVIAVHQFADLDNLDLRNWAIFTGILAFLALIGGLFWIKGGALAVSATWAVWLCFIGSLVYAVWFFERLDRNRWAVEIAMLKADNAARVAHGNDGEPLFPPPPDTNVAEVKVPQKP